jgi:hypothetical protein
LNLLRIGDIEQERLDARRIEGNDRIQIGQPPRPGIDALCPMGEIRLYESAADAAI